MRRNADAWVFGITFAVLTVVLGGLLWQADAAAPAYGLGRGMLAVPVVSAMLAARGFGWRRKLVYAGITLGVYLLAERAAELVGIEATASRDLRSASAFLSLPTLVYLAFNSMFPLLMLVLFVGRNPALLWSKAGE